MVKGTFNKRASVSASVLPDPVGPISRDIALGELHIIAGTHALGAARLQPLVMVVHRHAGSAIAGAFPGPETYSSRTFDFPRLGELVAGALGALFQLFPDYIVAASSTHSSQTKTLGLKQS